MKKTLLVTAVSALISTASFSALAEHGKGHEEGKFGLFKHADTNNDGVVTKEEFQANSEKRFTDMDTNKDGKLTEDELKEHKEKMKEERKKMKEERKEEKKDTEEKKN